MASESRDVVAFSLRLSWEHDFGRESTQGGSMSYACLKPPGALYRELLGESRCATLDIHTCLLWLEVLKEIRRPGARRTWGEESLVSPHHPAECFMGADILQHECPVASV